MTSLLALLSENNRLATFSQPLWNQQTIVSKRELAKNGFFSTGNGLEAECNWCHKRFQDWHLIYNIKQAHCLGCVFLHHPDACGNVSLANAENTQQQQEEQQQQQAQEETCGAKLEESDLFIEKNRLATFKNWPNENISPQSLAKAGFFYLNRSDEVKCAWCQGVMAKWEKEDNAFEEHKRFFPECPRVQLGPLIEFASSSGIKELGIQKLTPPKNPKFASLDARLRTFSNWPISHIQKPDQLAQAGLYYQSIDDQVRCFHCNIGLRSWQKEDDAWFEHAKWYPLCQFIHLAKGPSFVKQVHELVGKNNPQQQSLQEQQQQSSLVSIDEAMLMPPARTALEIGIDGGTVRNAIRQRLEAFGSPFSTLDDLLKAIFEETEQSNDVPPTTISSKNINGGSLRPQSNYANTSLRDNSNNDVEPSVSSNCAVKSINSTDIVIDRAREELETKESKVSNSKSLTLEEENRKLKDARLCKVCLDEEVCVVFLPCGHLVTCMQCAPGVEQCPMCRSEIKGFVRTFLS